MFWIHHYQLFLFDLDGLLVNTEEFHYQAYKRMCAKRGYTLSIDFSTYFKIAQQDAGALEKFIYSEFPLLYKEEPRWEVLYQEKKALVLEILQEFSVPLLPGVSSVLSALEKAKKKMLRGYPF